MIIHSIFLFILCIIIAFIEVQIEGREGWAKELPTWRPINKWFVNLYKKIMDNRELTGYHLGIYALVLFILHTPFWYGWNWSLYKELHALSDFFLVAVVWDFLWFVINPYYGWQKFKPIFIAWHKKWLGPWPLSYYWGILLSVILFMFSSKDIGSNLTLWLKQFLSIFLMVIFVVLIRFVFDNKHEKNS